MCCGGSRPLELSIFPFSRGCLTDFGIFFLFKTRRQWVLESKRMPNSSRNKGGLIYWAWLAIRKIFHSKQITKEKTVENELPKIWDNTDRIGNIFGLPRRYFCLSRGSDMDHLKSACVFTLRTKNNIYPLDGLEELGASAAGVGRMILLE